MMLIPIPSRARAAAAISDLAHATPFALRDGLPCFFFWYRWQPLDQFDRDMRPNASF